MGAEQLSLIWESELVRDGDGRVRLVAKTPKKDLNVSEAAKVLKLSNWTVRKLWRMGLLKGSKPGAAVRRKDQKGSNAALVLDSASVLAYKARQDAAALQEQDSGHW